MKVSTQLVAAGLAVALLAGCEGTQLGKAQRAQTTGSEFSKGLHKEYVGLSKSEFGEGDYRDSDRFAYRAIAAAGGEEFDPQPINQRNLPQGSVGELTDARAELMKALTSGARQKMPADSARAQAMFDCWMQEQEENFQPKDIAACRAGFLESMAKVNAGIQPVRVAAPAPAAPPPAQKTESFAVYFDFDSDQLTPASQRSVADAIDAAKRIGAKDVLLVGHADRSGADKYNDLLSMQRIRTIADQMRINGLSPKIITVDAKGERAPPVPTPDGKREQRNRVVEIRIAN